MANRPCKPDADLKRLWQLLLPNTRFPACGAPENLDSAADHATKNEAGNAKPRVPDQAAKACAAGFAASGKLEFNKE